MFTQLLDFALSKLLYLALHLESNGVFPKPLTSKEETECFKLIEEGNQEGKNRLIEHNLRLVAHIIKKYYSNSREQDDLISIGTIGLIKAVSTFDYKKGTRFATYASKCIENEILMHFRTLKKTASEIHFEQSVDVDRDGNELKLMDIVADSGCMVETVDLRIKSQQLYKFLNECLDERECEIIKLRYGLYGKHPLTQREVAKRLNISRSYVSRIEKKALHTLRKKYEKTPMIKT